MKAPGVTRGSWPARLAVLSAVASVASGGACYSTGGGSPPPLKQLYFPVGLAVNQQQNLLYVANSDFDLQWNGGTVQAYDLNKVRADALLNIVSPGAVPTVKYVNGGSTGCLDGGAPAYNDGTLAPLTFSCAPPTHESDYWLNATVIGAFATDLQLAPDGTRLYVPVRGNASLTWFDIDSSGKTPVLGCDADGSGRCGATHQAGSDPNEPGNTRHITMPGEPFGMAISADGESIAITHQSDTKTSLFSARQVSGNAPSLQFVLDGVPAGGNGLALVPHDLKGLEPGQPTPGTAFLETSRSVAELDLLRIYSDQTSALYPGSTVVPADAGDGVPATDAGAAVILAPGAETSSVWRPFLVRERAYALTANASGTDSRGVAIDDTPRRACRMALAATASDAEKRACAQLPARVFFANRTPESLLIGEIGGRVTASGTPTYDFDKLTIFANEPLSNGPSKLYLAPVVDATGHFALRLFIICFDSSTIFVWDPDAQRIENIIRTGHGPFAMTFDTFDLDQVAARAAAPRDAAGVPSYHFAYVASFTESYVQVLNLDNSTPSQVSSYEQVVFTLGQPTLPKGS